jgi:hypothetical protein
MGIGNTRIAAIALSFYLPAERNSFAAIRRTLDADQFGGDYQDS